MRDHSTQAAYEAWLARYFEQDPPTTRLLDSEVRELLLDGYPEGFGRFLIARAHNSEQGRKLSKETVAIRETILELQESYEVMTVRQVFYALTVRGIVPKTEATGYVPVQRQVLELRRQGFLPWGFIADGTRWARAPRDVGLDRGRAPRDRPALPSQPLALTRRPARVLARERRARWRAFRSHLFLWCAAHGVTRAGVRHVLLHGRPGSKKGVE